MEKPNLPNVKISIEDRMSITPIPKRQKIFYLEVEYISAFNRHGGNNLVSSRTILEVENVNLPEEELKKRIHNYIYKESKSGDWNGIQILSKQRVSKEIVENEQGNQEYYGLL